MIVIIRLMLFVTLFTTTLSVMSQNDRLQIVASHSILGDVVNNIVGDVADVSLLMPAGADPHSFQPIPSDLTAIAKADVVFINGAFFEAGLLEAIENAGENIPLIEVSACVQILGFGVDESAHEHEHEDDHDHEDNVWTDLCDQHDLDWMNLSVHNKQIDSDDAIVLGRLSNIECGEDHADEDHEDEDHADEDHADEHHHEGGCDPHVWMNPSNVMYWVMLIRDTLIELDPANTESYIANADSYLAELVTLVDDFIIPLVDTLPQEKRILIANHDSLGYLTTTFGFKTIGTIIPGGSTLAEPSIQDIARIIDLIQTDNIPAIFSETTANDNIAQTIADETGVQLVVLHSGSLSDENGSASTYIDYIRTNYTLIIEALGGGL